MRSAKDKLWRNAKSLLALFLGLSIIIGLLSLPALAAGEAVWADGSYDGTGTGYGGEMTVRVTISGGKITEIANVKNNETPRFWTAEAAKTLFERIISAQSTEVDAVSGATRSSNGAKAAVNDALSKATLGFSGGSGTEDAPYLISSEAGLNYLREQVEGGESFSGKYIKLTSDIALSGSWTPIGSSAKACFSGSFDGGKLHKRAEN